MTKPYYQSEQVTLYHGNALDVLQGMETASIDAVITDPPYPCIDRSYGYWTEEEWFALMNPVVAECRRVLKSSGSAVFVLQPNSERVGRMRTWLWEFMAKWGKEWGIVQDAYWWNFTALSHTKAFPNMMRKSVKPCVWLGLPDCHRDTSNVLWSESEANRAMREAGRCTNKLQSRVSRVTIRDQRARSACVNAGGVIPFNLLPIGSDGKDGENSHPGRTPAALCRWWTRYICPPGGIVLDPFAGSGTGPLAALAEERRAIGIERDEAYCAIAAKRIEQELSQPLLPFDDPPPVPLSLELFA